MTDTERAQEILDEFLEGIKARGPLLPDPSVEMQLAASSFLYTFSDHCDAEGILLHVRHMAEIFDNAQFCAVTTPDRRYERGDKEDFIADVVMRLKDAPDVPIDMDVEIMPTQPVPMILLTQKISKEGATFADLLKDEI